MRRLTCVAVALAALAGCSDPCETLSTKVCSDLGADCSIWEKTVRAQVIPLETLRAGRQKLGNSVIKQRAEDKFCRNLAADQNYAGYTLVHTKHLVRLAKDPKTAGPAPKLPALTPVSGFF